MRTWHTVGVLALGGLSIALAAEGRAGGDKVAFPEGYGKGVLYGTVDRVDLKQFRELYAPAEAVAAVKAGKAIPEGTVITMVNYKAKLDAAGNPVKDGNGRFVKGDIAGFAVMEKRKGWGAEYPEDVRNGEWEYQAFTPAKAVNGKANLKGCFTCHKPQAAKDYVFSLDLMKK